MRNFYCVPDESGGLADEPDEHRPWTVGELETLQWARERAARAAAELELELPAPDEPLRRGERIVDGKRLYSAAWLVVALVALVLGSAAVSPPRAVAAELPAPTIHVGPPAAWAGVECRRATIVDPRYGRLVFESCYFGELVRPVRGVWPA